MKNQISGPGFGDASRGGIWALQKHKDDKETLNPKPAALVPLASTGWRINAGLPAYVILTGLVASSSKYD